MSKYVYLTDQMIEEIIKEEGVTRPKEGGKCDLCNHQFFPEQLLEYFMVDFDEDIMQALCNGDKGYSRYGWTFCHRCYNIIDAFMHKCGNF